jgi:hypothetical protein
MSEEQGAARDRDMACELSGTRVSSSVKPWAVTSEEMDDELLAKFAALWMKGDEDGGRSTQREHYKKTLSKQLTCDVDT